jgi:hypothetical protein
MVRCACKTADGNPCKKDAITGSKYCTIHSKKCSSKARAKSAKAKSKSVKAKVSKVRRVLKKASPEIIGSSVRPVSTLATKCRALSNLAGEDKAKEILDELIKVYKMQRPEIVVQRKKSSPKSQGRPAPPSTPIKIKRS